jgi:heme A synthase
VAVGVTDRGTASAGRRRADKKSEPGPRRWTHVLLIVLGVLAATGAWVFLVRAAIDFGQAARNGQGLAWAVCAAATLGAAVCLLLVFVLIARGWALLGLHSDYQPRRSSGRRASR